MLREDSEGYAKLVVALNHFGDATLQPHMIPALYHEIQVRADPRPSTRSHPHRLPAPALILRTPGLVVVLLGRPASSS